MSSTGKPLFVIISSRVLLASLLMIFIIGGCTKIDTTNLGGDLIPAVDNVNTFADTLTISTSQGEFLNDSTRVFRSDIHVLGNISNDPLLGETRAAVYLQLKPSSYPYYYGRGGDTINPTLAPGTGYDSVILCLSYRGFWGDTTLPLDLQVLEVNQNNNNWDSVFKIKDINFAPATGTELGAKVVDIRGLKNVVRYANRRDSSTNQVRIRLTGLEPSLFQCDTSTNNYFRSDSLFKRFINGLGIIARSGNGLMYISLTDTSTKLEVHYRRKKGGGIDTTYSSFKLEQFGAVDSTGKFTIKPSSTANNIVRNRPALPSGDQEILLQTQPGTYAELFVDSLNNYSNRIIHRASLQMQQIPGDPFFDSIFTAPPIIYLDLKDTSTTPKWKPVYFDLSPNTRYDPDYTSGLPYFPANGVDYSYFGGFSKSRQDNSGRIVTWYEFNLTRYLQQLVTRRTPNYKIRLYAPFQVSYPQYGPLSYNYGNRLALGRVKLAGGAHPSTPMKLVVVYSVVK